MTYTLVAGRPPLEGANLMQTLLKIQQEVPPRPKRFQLGIPDAFDGVVMKLLSKQPQDRYASATELLRELDRVARSQGVSL